MSETTSKKYAPWQKAVLIGCVLIAVLGTLGAIGGLIKVSATLSDYGGSFSVPLLIAFVLMLLSVWLFAGLGAMVVYIAKTNSEIKEALAR
jgi:hypothetical protein